MNPFEMAMVIAQKEDCPCSYLDSVSVVERFKGKVAWDGIVFVFGLYRPPKQLCYGWVDPDAQTLVTVLNRPPVDSPETAVRAYIASRGK